MPNHELSFHQQLSRTPTLAVATLSLALVLAAALHAEPVKVVYGLPGYNFGAGGLIADAAGNLYGTAQLGSTGNCIYGDQCGVVFELSPSGSGWNSTIIYNFTGVTDGASPSTGLIFDTKGNLYGATTSTIYRLSPASSGGWTETTLYTFSGKSDGAFPTGPLAVDAAGNVYGTTNWGGSFSGSCSANGCGVAFKLSPNADGSYTETTLHTFTGGADGAIPVGGVLLLGQNLYGATSSGGSLSHCSGSGCGVIFELIPGSSNSKEFVLHSFSGGSDGSNPLGTLVANSSGNLFGTNSEWRLSSPIPPARGRRPCSIVSNRMPWDTLQAASFSTQPATSSANPTPPIARASLVLVAPSMSCRTPAVDGV